MSVPLSTVTDETLKTPLPSIRRLSRAASDFGG